MYIIWFNESWSIVLIVFFFCNLKNVNLMWILLQRTLDHFARRLWNTWRSQFKCPVGWKGNKLCCAAWPLRRHKKSNKVRNGSSEMVLDLKHQMSMVNFSILLMAIIGKWIRSIIACNNNIPLLFDSHSFSITLFIWNNDCDEYDYECIWLVFLFIGNWSSREPTCPSLSLP